MTSSQKHFIDTSAPRYREEATTSWWVNAKTHEELHTAAQRELDRMQRSRAAQSNGGIIVAHIKNGR